MAKTKTVQHTLAELLGVEVEQALRVFEALDKMNLEVIPKVDRSQEEIKRNLTIDTLNDFIQEFIRTKVKKPANLINFFPAKELAARIVERFKV